MAEFPAIPATMDERAPLLAQKVSPPPTSSIPSDSPQGFVDTALDSRVFFPLKDPGTGSKPSRAKVDKTTEGIYSHDPILDQNPNELWLFLLSHLRQPRMAVQLIGTHTKRIADDRTITVTDFSIRIDVSKYVIPECSRIVAAPSSCFKLCKSTGRPVPTLREKLEDYTRSNNPWKEFRVEKLVVWDYELLTRQLENLVNSTGYPHSITVSFPMQNYKVVARASSRFSKAVNSRVVQMLCVFSCLFFVARKRIDGVACEYGMSIGTVDFFKRYSARIRDVVKKSTQKFFALPVD